MGTERGVVDRHFIYSAGRAAQARAHRCSCSATEADSACTKSEWRCTFAPPCSPGQPWWLQTPMDTAARCRSCLFGERGWNADADGDEQRATQRQEDKRRYVQVVRTRFGLQRLQTRLAACSQTALPRPRNPRFHCRHLSRSGPPCPKSSPLRPRRPSSTCSGHEYGTALGVDHSVQLPPVRYPHDRPSSAVCDLWRAHSRLHQSCWHMGWARRSRCRGRGQRRHRHATQQQCNTRCHRNCPAPARALPRHPAMPMALGRFSCSAQSRSL